MPGTERALSKDAVPVEMAEMGGTHDVKGHPN